MVSDRDAIDCFFPELNLLEKIDANWINEVNYIDI